MRFNGILLAGLALACFVAIGCETSSQTPKTDDHDHAAEGGHAHGPNNGHPFKFEGGEYQGEWKHYNDNSVIRVYILDAAGKTNTAVKADSVTITRLAGDVQTFTLDAEDPNENGEAVVYSLDDQNLAIAMNVGVKIEMKIGDKTYSAKIAEHQPHDH